MSISTQELLTQCTVKQVSFRVPSLNKEIIIRQLTINEVRTIRELQKKDDSTQEQVIYETLKSAMVEPTFFNEEELKNLTALGEQVLFEIYQEIPLIGKTEEQRVEYQKMIDEVIKSSSLKDEKKEDEAKK